MTTDNEALGKLAIAMCENLKLGSLGVSDEALNGNIDKIIERNSKIISKILEACHYCYPEESGLARKIFNIYERYTNDNRN